ncbi:MAG TPA: hypothetical protein VJG90_00775 [Candidatus Nanoarchaeia archaeon]|nr:hypothetical protein [Candidatus Nanoarchaeia archaeon]
MEEPNEVHLSNRSVFKLVFGFVFILILAGSLYLVYTHYLTSKSLLDVKTEPKEPQILPHEALRYHVELTNLGQGERFDATLTYRLMNMEGQILSNKQETLAVSTSLSVDREITLPARAQPGKYQLKTLVNYGKNQAASALFTFEIVTEKTSPVIPSETTPSILTPTEPIPPEEKERFQDFLLRIEETATNNPAAAQNACEQQNNPAEHDDCLRVVVKTSRRAEFCDPIRDDNIRDNCYLSFITEGNSALCGKITLENNKDYCNRLRDIDLLSKYYQSQGS